MRTWVEDFVDEDTGEVVSIDRNEVVIDSDSVLEKEHIDPILEAGVDTIIFIRKMSIPLTLRLFNTLQKDNSNSEKEAVEQIYRQLRNY